MVVFEVDGVIVRRMRGHELGLFAREYIKEIVVLRRDDLCNKLPFVRRERLRVEGGSRGRIVSDGLELGRVLGQTDQQVAKGKDLIALVYQLLESRGSNKTDWSCLSPLKRDGVHFFQEG